MKPTPEMIEAGAQAIREVSLREGATSYSTLAEAAIQAALNAMWQPIETCPKFTNVLVWDGLETYILRRVGSGWKEPTEGNYIDHIYPTHWAPVFEPEDVR